MKKSTDNNALSRRQVLKAAAATTAGVFLAGFPVAASSAEGVPVFDVVDYGAVGDGKTLDTAALQKAIDAAAATGKKARVLVRGGHQYLIGTIVLKGGIDFHLQQGAELLVSTQQEDYTAESAAIIAHGASHLTLSGTGIINGRALEFMSHYEKENEWWIPKAWRPKLFILTRCNNLTVRDITIAKAPSWSLHMLGCENVLIDNIRIENNLDVPNCDGIDPDHCRNVDIRNCRIVCGDDAIVIKTTRQTEDYGPSANIRVSDCILETQDSGVKIGTETTQDIYNIRFERCTIKSSCRGLTIQLRDEGNVYNVVFSNINFVSRYHSDPWWGRGEAISVTAIPRTPETNIGTIGDVTIKNCTGRAENSVRINGTKESRIRNVTLENVDVTLDRWTRYPGKLFDNRPTTAYEPIEPHSTPGYSVRYADNIRMKNCRIVWGKNLPDYFSHAIEAHHVTRLKIKGFTGGAAHPERDKDFSIADEKSSR